MIFRDHFSRQADLYAKYRPSYPLELFEYLAGLAPAHHLAWDCATGNGQAAVSLADHFDRVIATDASASQIAHTEANSKISYRVASADSSGLEAATADLIAVAQALHWLDVEEFYREARRVSVKGGVIAVWGYGDPVMDGPEIERVVHAFNRESLESYWAPNRDLLLGGYRALPFPFRELSPPRFELKQRWTLPQLAGYFRTWSATNRYVEEVGVDPVPALEAELAAKWGEPHSARLVRWPLFLRVGICD